ncbi:MAG: PIN domain-containing protein [Thermoplasmata archaeon]
MIILDTNALIYAARQRINLTKFIKEEIVVPSSVMDELNALSARYNYARIAKTLASRFRVVSVENGGDEGVIEAVKRYGGIVLTNDRELIRRLKKEKLLSCSVSESTVRQ